MENETTEEKDVVRSLTKPQRRVLGVLLEKAFTTPDQYPLTCKSATSGSNQKSNRSPVTNYSEDAILDTLDELRELGLVLQLHTESGRTERYRHLMRQHYSFTEPQLAILTELMLRGRQTLGELRSRASRMVAIDSLDSLRTELQGLADDGFAHASGPLERRGVEVDHGLYTANESGPDFPAATSADAGTTPAPAPADPSPAPSPVPPAPSLPEPVVRQLEEAVTRLEAENRELREQVESLRTDFRQLESRFDDLRRDLGG